ncbi:hypothetical protein [Microcoleus sp. D3_18a_C4]|uniref:hypothetical protein n=1 Tax=Microcoleus sp. D3_18a_C4 TaxID=3055332 RepID=UPI002FD53317
MDNRPLTPREKIEERRSWRYWCRWYRRHHRCGGFVLYGELIPQSLAEFKQVGLADYLESQAQLLKPLWCLAKFCNGLIGVSLTDSVIAPVIN